MNRESWLPAAPESAAEARRIVRAAAAERGLMGGDALWDLMIATSEAVANAVEHGRPCPDGKILLRIDHMHDGLFVEVRDCGSFDAESSPLDGSRGRGLPIMRAVTDAFELTRDPDGTRVRFRKAA